MSEDDLTSAISHLSPSALAYTSRLENKVRPFLSDDMAGATFWPLGVLIIDESLRTRPAPH